MPRRDWDQAVAHLEIVLRSCGMDQRDVETNSIALKSSPCIAAHEVLRVACLISEISALVERRTRERTRLETTNALLIEVKKHFFQEVESFVGRRYIWAVGGSVPLPSDEVAAMSPESAKHRADESGEAPNERSPILKVVDSIEFDDTFNEEIDHTPDKLSVEEMARMLSESYDQGFRF